MDPYLTLGVARGCSRQEVKEAFRARAWHAHPDHGGEDESFIRLCIAYKQILEELDRRPNPCESRLAWAPRPNHRAAPPEPSWKPDVIFLDEVPPIRWPPKPLDPDWQPDLILLDEASPVRRFPQPSDPNAARKTYVSWLHHVAAESARRRSGWRSAWVGTLGTLIILALIVGGLWGCWIAWTYEAEQARAARLLLGRPLDHRRE